MAAEQERARLQAVADGKAAAASDPAQDDLSLHPVKEVIAKVRKNDAKKAFDIAAYNQFNATPLTVAPTAGTATDVVTLTTNGTVTITAHDANF